MHTNFCVHKQLMTLCLSFVLVVIKGGIWGDMVVFGSNFPLVYPNLRVSLSGLCFIVDTVVYLTPLRIEPRSL